VLFELAKVTVVKIINQNTLVCLVWLCGRVYYYVLVGVCLLPIPNSATDKLQLEHNNIFSHTTKLTTPMYFN
jgi:hypothetical protein